MALPLQEVISPPQEETSLSQTSPLPREEILLLPRETLLPQDEVSLPRREETSLSKEETSPPEEERLSRQHHAPIVSVAAKALAERDVPIVEYGEQIQWRYGDPTVPLVSKASKSFCGID